MFSNEISRILSKSNSHYCIPESLPVGMVPSRVNPVHNLPSNSVNIRSITVSHSRLALPSYFFLSGFLTHTLYACLFTRIRASHTFLKIILGFSKVITNDAPHYVFFSLFLSLPPAVLPLFTVSTSILIQLHPSHTTNITIL
jgi:hypothetical protein